MLPLVMETVVHCLVEHAEKLTDAQLRQLMDALEYEMCNRLAEQLTHTD